MSRGFNIENEIVGMYFNDHDAVLFQFVHV